MNSFVLEMVYLDEHRARKFYGVYGNADFEVTDDMLKQGGAKEINVVYKGEVSKPPTENDKQVLMKVISSMMLNDKALALTKEYTRMLRDKTYSTKPTAESQRYLFFRVNDRVFRETYQLYYHVVETAKKFNVIRKKQGDAGQDVVKLLTDVELDKITKIEDSHCGSIKLWNRQFEVGVEYK